MNLGLLDRQFSVVATGPTSVSATCPDTLATMSGNVSYAHEADGGQVLVEGQSIGCSEPISNQFFGRLNVCFG